MANQHEGPPDDGAPFPGEEVAPQPTAIVEYANTKAVSQANEAGASLLAARSAKEVEARAIMAMRRPRDAELFRRRLLESCKRPMFAMGREEGKGAIYRRKVGNNKFATGLSIRFSEECARLYGNLDIRATLISEDEERRIFESSATDLETNAWYTATVVVPKTVWRRDPKGQKPLGQKLNSENKITYLIPADDDSLLVLQANMLAKAQREVVLKLVPSDIKEEAFEQILGTMKAEVKRDPAMARKRVLDAFYARGVMPAQVAELLGHAVEVMTEAEIIMLKEYGVAMAEEGLSWAEVTQSHRAGDGTQDPAPAAKGADALKAKLARKAAAAAKAAPAIDGVSTDAADVADDAKKNAGTPAAVEAMCEDCGEPLPNHGKFCPRNSATGVSQ